MANPLWRKTFLREYIEKFIFTPARQTLLKPKILSIGKDECLWDFFQRGEKQGKPYYVSLKGESLTGEQKNIEDITQADQDGINVHIIYGEEGSGKTTSLCKIMVDSLEKDSSKKDYLSVFMDLKKFENKISLEQWLLASLQAENKIEAKFRKYLQAGLKFMLLFDLSSAAQQQQNQIINTIKNFLETHPDCSLTLILTARGIEFNWLNASFIEYQITPKCWKLKGVTLDKALEYYENLKGDCDNKESLKNFIENHGDNFGVLSFTQIVAEVDYEKDMTICRLYEQMLQLYEQERTSLKKQTFLEKLELYRDYKGEKYIPDFDFRQHIIAISLDNHIVREEIIEKINSCLTKKVKYIEIEGAAGTGKTALMSYLAITNGYAHYFIKNMRRLYKEDIFIKYLGQQLIKKYNLTDYRENNFSNILEQIDENTNQQVVILIDGLDEYDRHGGNSKEIKELITGC